MMSEHRDHYVSRDGEAYTLHMTSKSFLIESAATIVVGNEYQPGRFDRDDADHWYDLACKGNIIFW